MNRLDFGALRQIPILLVAEALGHEVFRGNIMRCPVPEAHAADYTRPTMGLDVVRNRAKCFACGASGGPLDLVVWSKSCTLKDAATYVANLGDQPVPSARPARSAPRPADASREPSEEDIAVFRSFFDLCARVETVPEIAAYLARRLPPAWGTYDRVGLRAVADHEALAAGLRHRHSEHALRQAGVFNDSGRFRLTDHRLVAFFLKTDRRPYSFQARRLGDDQPRFLNPLGLKVPSLLGQVALRGLRPWSEVYLAEGVFDTLTLSGLGLPAVGLPGAGVARHELLKVLSKYRVIYVPQNDEAGAASVKAVERVLRWLRVLRLPIAGADVNDHFRRLGEAAVFDLLTQEVPS